MSPTLLRAAARGAATLLALLLMAAGIAWARVRPSHERAWRIDQAVLPEIAFEDSLVLVRGVRNFAYRTADDFAPRYDARAYDLRKLERVWFVLSPFNQKWRGPAHAFLTFGFSDGQYVSVSIEARREAGEEYSIWQGMLRRFELIYVIGDERDLVALRAAHWNDPTYLYPIAATPEQVRAVFTRMLRRAQQLHAQPEFYHTLLNNCTTNLLRPVNEVAAPDRRIRYGWRVLLPGYSDDLAYRLGLIDDDRPIEELRARYRINERAREAVGAADFSERIRGR